MLFCRASRSSSRCAVTAWGNVKHSNVRGSPFARRLAVNNPMCMWHACRPATSGKDVAHAPLQIPATWRAMLAEVMHMSWLHQSMQQALLTTSILHADIPPCKRACMLSSLMQPSLTKTQHIANVCSNCAELDPPWRTLQRIAVHANLVQNPVSVKLQMQIIKDSGAVR